ncbi:hypothetical protein CHARACLAT_026672 [Characodon lateralis]|uniref:Secreted protein n=1 Tax=Characodon lateralis TaxID=208331 RepID=A0ABU7CTP3_9TELE|nr:hypothetical protein [Characodon lateralis]
MILACLPASSSALLSAISSICSTCLLLLQHNHCHATHLCTSSYIQPLAGRWCPCINSLVGEFGSVCNLSVGHSCTDVLGRLLIDHLPAEEQFPGSLSHGSREGWETAPLGFIEPASL